MAAHPSSYSPESSNTDSNWYRAAGVGDVPTTVRKLLFSTKRLQEVLRLWSTEEATDADVSDVYVQIGHEFNAVITAFAYHSIDLSDLHSIPAELRVVLERCLSEDPSPALVETYMPDLRKVLYKLLKGLQGRQGSWRASTYHLSNSRMTPVEST